MPLLLAVMLRRDVSLDTGLFVITKEWLALLIFLSATITDLLDGYLARRRCQVTTLGKLLDPIADKLLISAAFISLVELGRVPAWMVVIIVGRELAVSGLRSIAIAEGYTIEVSDLGKIKMAAQVASVSLLLVSPLLSVPYYWIFNKVAYVLLYFVVLCAIISMIGYFRAFWGCLEGSPVPPSSPTAPELLGLRKSGKQDTIT